MKMFALFCCILFCTSGYNQQFAVENPMQNWMYKDIGGPLRVVVQGYKCDSVRLSCEQGKFSKDGDCSFYFTPKKSGIAIINIEGQKKGKWNKIGQYEYRIKQMPPPVAAMGPTTGGPISKSTILAIGGIRTLLDNTVGVCGGTSVKTYTAKATRNGMVLFELENEGMSFSETLKESIMLLQLGDEISFTDILSQFNSDTLYKSKPITYTITSNASTH